MLCREDGDTEFCEATPGALRHSITGEIVPFPDILRRLQQLHEPLIRHRPIVEVRPAEFANSLVSPFCNLGTDESCKPSVLGELGQDAIPERFISLEAVSLTSSDRVGEIMQIAEVLETDAKQPFRYEPTDP